MKKSLLALAAAASLSTLSLSAHAGLLDGASLAWTHQHSVDGDYLSEIIAFDDARNELWVAGVTGIDILSAVDAGLAERRDRTGRDIERDIEFTAIVIGDDIAARHLGQQRIDSK
mgnify:CR=1 FL=1